MQTGTRLGHYEILGRLGAGGMGEVYRAHDTRLSRDVAIKVLPQNMAHDRDRLVRFEREARAIAALDHPNVVTLYSVEEHAGVHFLTMQVVEGASLAEVIPEGGLPMGTLLRLVIPLVDAIGSAHKQGITHRDLKPSNVMVGADERVRVLDFGLAKLLDERQESEGREEPSQLTQEGDVLGTAAYMSPEQAEGRPLDHRSDIFALGILLYEMATGRRPFDADTRAATVASILRDQPTSIGELRGDAPERLEQIVDRCLAKQPERRYRAAMDLRDELVAVQGELTSAGPSGGPNSGHNGEARRAVRQEMSSDTEAVVGLVRRHRTISLIAAVVLVLAALGGLWALQNRGGGGTTTEWITTRLTSVQGLEMGMDWSPHGDFIVFAHSSRGNFDIAVKSTAGGAWVDLTNTPEDEIFPRWSPDNRWVAYLKDAPSGATIDLVSPTGGEPWVLVNTKMRIWAGVAQATDAMGASPWSPDGAFLLYPQWEESTGATPIFKIPVGNSRGRSGVPLQLTHPAHGVFDMAPSWSPDGRRIVFQRADNTGHHLWLVAADGGEEELLFDDEFPAGRPDWSIDGKRIVFDSRRAGSNDVWEIDIDDPNNPRQVTFAPGSEGIPAVSPTGGVGYQTFVHRSDVYRQRIDDTEAERDPLIVETPGIDNFGARMSPNGQSAVYYSDRSGNYEIWLLDLASGEKRALTTHPAQDIVADWSPDGQIVFLSNRDGAFHLWTLDPDRPQPQRVSPQVVTNWHVGNSFSQGPRWSRDGKLIAYLATDADGPALWTIAPDGTDARRRLPGVIWFGWYRDSRRVIYTRTSEDGSRTELWAADMESEVQIRLLTEPIDEIDVAPDGSAISFQTGVSHIGMRLRVLQLTEPDPSDGLPRAAGSPRTLPAAGGIWHVHNSSWSWDGTAILYTRDEDEGSIYVTEQRH